MTTLSILVPARNEEWLWHTVRDVLAHTSDATEIIVVLDGAWPPESLPQDPRLQVVYLPTAIGQRAATNLAARLSTARYICKLDAHCAVAPGFDQVLLETARELGDDVTQIPAQKNLHVYDWRCRCGWVQYQGVAPATCPQCQRADGLERVVVWQPRRGSTTTSWVFDSTPHFQYDKAGQARQRGNVCDVMTSLGACFFMARERFWALGGLDEAHGSWGSFGIEVACKSWLSGGRHVVNKKTWFAHFFRVGGIRFPYPIRGSEQEAARARARAIWFNDAWPQQVRPLRWLVDKFWPVPGWTEEQRDALPTRSVFPSFASPPDTDLAASESVLVRRGQLVTSDAMSLASVVTPDATKQVVALADQSEVFRVTAPRSVADDVIEDRISARQGSNQPSPHKAMNEQWAHADVLQRDAAVAVHVSEAIPQPTSIWFDGDVGKQSSDVARRESRNCERLRFGHGSASDADLWQGSAPRSQRGVGPPSVSASIVYYSDCRLDERIALTARRHIEASGLPVVAVTLCPIDWPAATNVVLALPRGPLSMFRQILAGLEAATSDVVFLAEHDLWYAPDHFAFRPPTADRYYYNVHTWCIDVATGRAVFYRAKRTSGLCASRDLLIRHYRERVRRVEAEGFSRRMGFEPGSHGRRERVDDVPAEEWRSTVPNIDLRHGQNLTPSRWSPSEFRDRRNCQEWTEAREIPGWGPTDDILAVLRPLVEVA